VEAERGGKVVLFAIFKAEVLLALLLLLQVMH